MGVALFDELEEGRHVGTTEMIDGLQAGKEALLGQALKVVLTNILKPGQKRA